MSTLSLEAQHHQRALQSTTQAFIATMWSDGHDRSNYEDFIKDMKFILDTHISDLKDCSTKDVTKMVIATIWDLDCKYLRPAESTTKSSDEDFPTQFKRLDDDVIIAEFPDNMLTSEVRTRVTNCLDYMEQSHTTPAATLKEAKKLMSHIPARAFRLLLQPVIKLKGWCVLRITKTPEPKGFSFLDMLPNDAEAHNLPTAVLTFTAALTLSIKDEYCIKASMHRVSNLFDVQ